MSESEERNTLDTSSEIEKNSSRSSPPPNDSSSSKNSSGSSPPPPPNYSSSNKNSSGSSPSPNDSSSNYKNSTGYSPPPNDSSSNKNSSGSSPPPNQSSSNGNVSSPFAANLQESEGDNSPPAPPPSSGSSDSSPPPNDYSDEQSPSLQSDTDPPETSPTPSPPENSPPPNTPPPPSEESSPQSSPSSVSGSPPSTPKKQSPPPPSPPKQQSPPPPSSPSQESSQSSPGKSPPPPADPHDSSRSSPPPPPPSAENSQSPPSTNFTSTSSPVFSPPPVNRSTKSSPGFSPQALAPPGPNPSKSPPNSGDGSSNSGGSSNNRQNNINDTKSPRYDVVIGVTVAGVFIIAFLALCFFIRRRKKRRSSPYANYMPPPANFRVTSDAYMGPSGQNDAGYYNSQFHGQQSSLVNSSESQRGQNYHGPESDIIAGSKTFFTYEELMEMTKGFARQNVIGEGGFGCVYKGWMPDGKVVAVKQLKAGSGQGDREFRAEVEIISRVHHRHLVSLVGHCIAEKQKLLIYEFVPNKTLEHHLHSKELPVLEWAKRVKIAVGAAKGLAYLHEDCHPKIIHRDIKSANILLENDFEAQVADFGLARLNDTTQTHVSTRVMGTFGYLAPEYASSGKLTDRSDVYSFGVVLLELITGRKPVDPTQPLGDESLVEWARPLLIEALETGDFSELIDPRLEKRYVESQVFMMIEAAAACVRHSAAKRPRMSLVVRALDFDAESDLSNGVKFGQSTVYDSGQYSEEIIKFRRMALGSDISSEFDMYSGEYNSREVSGGQPNSWKSRYSSGDFTSGESETLAFKPNSGEYSGASGNYDGGRFK
ncbi:hypothetical protein DITRI_Ditri12bG0065400 [Diplodiscus trichospermus]